jgi:hypothetical protein
VVSILWYNEVFIIRKRPRPPRVAIRCSAFIKHNCLRLSLPSSARFATRGLFALYGGKLLGQFTKLIINAGRFARTVKTTFRRSFVPPNLPLQKDKYENEELIRFGLPEDVWFHVDELSSAHVYLRQKPGQKLDDISSDLLLECSSLVKVPWHDIFHDYVVIILPNNF